MKNLILVIIFALCLSFIMGGCSSKDEVSKDEETKVEVQKRDDKAKEGMDSKTAQEGNMDRVDKVTSLDLSTMSNTMVFGHLSAMLQHPEDYQGATIRIAGKMLSNYDKDMNFLFPACYVADAAACCQMGIGYNLEGKTYPEGYPEDGEDIVVEGIFELASMGSANYINLKNARLVG